VAAVTKLTAAQPERVFNEGKEVERRFCAMMTGVILAGGHNRTIRGKPKALLPFGTETLVERELRLMRPVCSELIVVTNDPQPFLRLLEPDVRIITDFVPNRGPLAGMHAGLSLARNRDVWIVGGHMPFVSAKAAAMLQKKKQEGHSAALPWVQGGVYPLHGVYDRSCADKTWSLLQDGEPTLARLLKEMSWVGIRDEELKAEAVEPNFVASFNTEELYEQLLQKLQVYNS
jgi:molybdopterin-guanine dinucleotide biosynthesis protein A